MKPKIFVTTQYGFAHYWTLFAFGKSFYLGQDGKFCSRVLGMDSSEVAAEIGDNNLADPATNEALAEFICDRLNLTAETVREIEPWGICAE